MALVTALIRDIAQLVRPCPNAVITAAYLRAARQLCGESRWYQANYDFTTDAGVQSYAIQPPVASGQAATELEVVALAVFGHWINVNPTAQAFWQRLVVSGPDFNPNIQDDTPYRISYTPEGGVSFEPTPDAAYPVTVRVAYQPTAQATDIPDDLLVKWRYVFEAGALAYLYGLDGEPFANPKKQIEYLRTYQAGIANAKANVAMQFQSGSRRANPRPFFPTSGFLLRR
jgi:hypothetical protein